MSNYEWKMTMKRAKAAMIRGLRFFRSHEPMMYWLYY
jgi:hypothetical protein